MPNKKQIKIKYFIYFYITLEKNIKKLYNKIYAHSVKDSTKVSGTFSESSNPSGRTKTCIALYFLLKNDKKE